MNLVAAPTELRDHILRQKTRIAARHIDVHILHANEAVQDGLKFVQKLHFVEKHIIHVIARDPFLQMRVQHIRITKPLVFKSIKCDLDDMRLINSLKKQMFLEKTKKKIRFPAPPQTRHYFDQTIMLFADQRIKVAISFYFHTPCLLLKISAALRKNLQQYDASSIPGVIPHPSTSPTGQWSLPKTSLWIVASLIFGARRSETRK